MRFNNHRSIHTLAGYGPNLLYPMTHALPNFPLSFAVYYC